MRWPDVAQLRAVDPNTTAVIERDLEVSGPNATLERIWVELRDVSRHLIRAVLVAEDIDFFSHDGFAWGELRLAAEEAWREGSPVRGASTITQQLAKNLWLSPERSLWRKAKEAALTIDLEQHLSKRRILELYLNVVGFGPGVFGVESAARHYFGKPALFLTERESAMLAAGLSRPSLWNPGEQQADGYVDRVELIERRMVLAEFLWRHLAAL